MVGKNSIWQAALPKNTDGIQEIQPALPLHDKNLPWINAVYVSGDLKKVDLTTLLKDSHLIKTFDLENSVSTAALYRILISLMYKLFVQEEERSDWNRTRVSKIRDNEGLDPQIIDEYFELYQDRFFLIHPFFPFFQDASLYYTYSAKAVGNTEEVVDRKDLSSKLSVISQIHPKANSTNSEDGQKVIWTLPHEDIYTTEKSVEDRISLLASALLHQRYAHPAVNRGVRKFLDSSSMSTDTHHATHALRCATSWVVECESLFQTLLLAMKYESPEDLVNDIPEWEEQVDSVTGLLMRAGKKQEYYNQYLSKDAPRSSVNSTHMAIIFVPEYDNESGMQSEYGGQVKQMRRLLFDFKTNVTATGEKMPFPLSWDPFVATKTDDKNFGKALKLIESISPATVLANPNIFRIPFLQSIKDVRKPEVLNTLETNQAVRKALGEHKKLTVKVLIFSGDPSKEKTFGDFSFTTKEMSPLFNDVAQQENIDSWINSGGSLKYVLEKSLINACLRYGEKIDLTSCVTDFWSQYYVLFNSVVQQDTVPPVQAYEQEIREMVLAIFDSKVGPLIKTRTYQVVSNKNILNAAIKNIIQGKK